MPQGTVWIWCQSLRARAWAQLGYQGATGLLFALGVIFRSNRYWLDPLGLWADEASWVRRLFKHTLTNFDFRPLGYMDVTQLVVHIYCDERTLRILSYVLDMYSCSPFEFYLGYDDGTRREFGNYLTDNFDFDCTQSPRGTQVFMRKLRGKSFFVVVTDDRVLAATRAVVHKGATVLDEERVREAHDLYYATGH